MSQATYRGVKYDTARTAKFCFFQKVEEIWRGVKYQKLVETCQK